MDVEETRKLAGFIHTVLKRRCILKQLKRTDVDSLSLIQFCCACIRSILEYACQSLFSSLTGTFIGAGADH